MDHIDIIKRAWRVAWRYKILWLFGLFAGGVSGGGGGGGGGNLSGTAGQLQPDNTLPIQELQRAGWWLQDNIGLVIVLFALSVLVAFILFISSIVAKGGLIHLVNEAEEGRPVRGLDGWATGLRMSPRVFGTGFVLYAPLALLWILVLLFAFMPLVTVLLRGSEPGVGVIISMLGVLAIGGSALLILGVFAGLLESLGLRHAVIGGTGVFASLKAAWHDVRFRFKDVIIVWLLMIGLGIGFGLVAAVIFAVFMFMVIGAAIVGLPLVAVFIGVLLFLALLLPAAIYNTFISAIWTIVFRRLTGREVPGDQSLIGYPPPYAPSAPSAPPSAPATSAPTPPVPAAPQPPAAWQAALPEEGHEA